ncbi:hypothetical protein VNO77_20980 [Canavalia gladiata]|uniref:Uncharacterized protein n=1 Tax=Canavalia gladiata TaxID=3824 RepID=A0AAN9QR34_CANGL
MSKHENAAKFGCVSARGSTWLNVLSLDSLGEAQNNFPWTISHLPLEEIPKWLPLDTAIHMWLVIFHHVEPAFKACNHSDIYALSTVQ